MENLLESITREEFRAWLAAHHATEKVCWVAVKRGKTCETGAFPYLDAVEEALCFGWIDSTLKTLPTGQCVQRFSPRKPRSRWTELNKERCRRLEQLGQMTDAGRAVLPDMTETGFVVEPDVLTELQADPIVWANIQGLPDLYRRVRIDTIQSQRKRPQVFRSRLEKFIANTRAGILYGAWNDDGRLLQNL